MSKFIKLEDNSEESKSDQDNLTVERHSEFSSLEDDLDLNNTEDNTEVDKHPIVERSSESSNVTDSPEKEEYHNKAEETAEPEETPANQNLGTISKLWYNFKRDVHTYFYQNRLVSTAPPPPLPVEKFSEEERRQIIDSIKPKDTIYNKTNALLLSNAAFDTTRTAIAGIIYATLVEFNNREEISFEDVEGKFFRNIDLAIWATGAAIAGMAVGITRNMINSRNFKPEIIAENIKSKLYQATPQQIEAALKICHEEGNLSQIKVHPSYSLGRLEDPYNGYLLGGLIASNSPVPEDKKYLILAASKVIACFLIDRCKTFFSTRQSEVSYLPEDFLSQFTEEEKKELGQGLVSELEKHTGPRILKQNIVQAATTFTFLGVLNNFMDNNTAKNMTENAMIQAERFATASMSANVARTVARTLFNLELTQQNNEQRIPSTEVADPELAIQLMERNTEQTH